jgi:hypothetical protein
MSPKEERPSKVDSHTVSTQCACDKLFAILGSWGGSLKEVFIKLGPQGSCAAAIVNALAVIVSKSLRYGVPSSAIANIFRYDRSLCSKSGDKPTCIVALGEILLEESMVEDSDYVFSVPMRMTGTERTMITGCGPIAVQCFDDSEGTLRKVGAELAQTNTCANTITKMTGKLITLSLSHGVDIRDITKGLRDISCPSARPECTSCLDAIARAISIHENQKVEEDPAPPEQEEL